MLVATTGWPKLSSWRTRFRKPIEEPLIPAIRASIPHPAESAQNGVPARSSNRRSACGTVWLSAGMCNCHQSRRMHAITRVAHPTKAAPRERAVLAQNPDQRGSRLSW